MAHSDSYIQVDRSAYTNRFAKSSPLNKTFFALSALVISVSSQSFVVPIAIFILCTILLTVFAKVKVYMFFDLLFYPTFMVALSCIFIALFFGSGPSLLELNLHWFTWTIFKDGISMSINTFFRVEAALSCLFFLVLTTSITNLCILLRKMHVPRILVEMSLLIYRYIFVFLDISRQMNIAQELRLGHSGWIKRIRSLALLAGNLFIRTLEQGERTFIAMNARGYDGNIRVLEDLPKPKGIIIAGIIIFDIMLIIAIFLTMTIKVV